MENNTNGVKKMPTPAKVSKMDNDTNGLSTQMHHTQRRLDGQEKNEFVDANLISLVGGDANAAHVLKTLIHLTNDRIAAGEQQRKIYLCYTLPHWQVLHFWFWSIDLVGRLFRKLVQFGLLELSKDPVTKRNSYSVDFAQIQNLLTVRINSSCNFASWISENFGECQDNDVSDRNNSSCNFTSSKQVDGQDNDVSYRNDSSCKSASSKNEQKNPENAGEQADEIVLSAEREDGVDQVMALALLLEMHLQAIGEEVQKVDARGVRRRAGRGGPRRGSGLVGARLRAGTGCRRRREGLMGEVEGEMERSGLQETGNILASSFLNALARWMGISDAQQLDIFPNLANFDIAKRNLGFML